MPTFTSHLLQLLALMLLLNETSVTLAMAFLATAHILLSTIYNIACYQLCEYYPLIVNRLPGCIDSLLATFNNYYEQVMVFARPVMQKGTVMLTNHTGALVRNAPCGLCQAAMWGVAGVKTVVEWMVGGVQDVALDEQWIGIKKEVASYCATIRGCA